MIDKTLLIDGDIFFYIASTVSAQTFDFGDGDPAVSVDPDEAEQAFDQSLSNLVGDLEFKNIVIAKSDDERNFRKGLADFYKANRDPSTKPVLLPHIKEYAKVNYEVLEWPRIEADDILGIQGSHPDENVVIQSGDKDLNQVPGLYLDKGKIKRVTPEEGMHQFWTQVLTGDPVDNYKGCPLIGPIRAARILDDVATTSEEVWPRIVQTYELAGLTEEDALLQARLAWILKHGDYRHSDNKVRLWKP